MELGRGSGSQYAAKQASTCSTSPASTTPQSKIRLMYKCSLFQCCGLIPATHRNSHAVQDWRQQWAEHLRSAWGLIFMDVIWCPICWC